MKRKMSIHYLFLFCILSMQAAQKACHQVQTADLSVIYHTVEGGCISQAKQQCENNALLVAIFADHVSSRKAQAHFQKIKQQVQQCCSDAQNVAREHLAQGVGAYLKEKLSQAEQKDTDVLALFVEDQWCRLDVQQDHFIQKTIGVEDADIALPSQNKPSFVFNADEWRSGIKEPVRGNLEVQGVCALQ